ncbi:MAG: (E)-4-hydroxy-3-methylbut-2-enyl-diphosphate synthase [Bacteroidales bacterium]|nr:(E)-4-hydroxy-3-methylbut-2-enyl-diphosphate synthase [Bacteroidales bacterium]
MIYYAREVQVGDIVIGGNRSIVVQSMTNTFTDDAISTTRQIIDLAKVGSKLVRLSIRNTKDVQALPKIHEQLKQKGVKIPLVADIHFNHELAILSAPYVQKVRVNPGNFFILKSKDELYSESDYKNELEAIGERFVRLIQECRRHGTAIRIGVNGGSLPNRILQRYGHTPQAMVQAMLEFVSMAHQEDFHHVVVSIKDSNVIKTIDANRLLVREFIKAGYDYPIHLGVTEAGSDLEGIIRSAIGIGTLLAEGIGNTIRVSLTGSPVKEIPVAYEIIRSSQKNYIDSSLNQKYLNLNSYQSLPELNLCSNYEQVPLVSSLKDIRMLLVNNPSLEGVRVSNDLKNEVDISIVLGEVLMKFPLACIVDERENLTDYYRLLFQVTGRNINGAEFISCPSCGRTTFDIETMTKQVKNTFFSYKGLTFAVMGCVVNGPGEISRADYGILGSKSGYVHLYAHGKIIIKNVPEREAVKLLKEIVDRETKYHSSSTASS